MSEWKEYKLGEVCSRLRSGKGIKAEFISNTGKYPVIGGNGVRGYTDSYNFEGQAAIIGRQGAYCGNVRFYEGQAHMTEHAVVVVGNELADTFFLACLLSRMHLGNLSGQSAQPGISVQTLSKQTLLLPSIAYQKQVSAIIKTFDDKIAVNKKICENLEAQAQALFKHWFVDFAPFKDGNFCANREQNETCFNSAEVQPKITGKACKFVESELGLIPEGWRVGRLEELCSFISRGLSPKYQLGTTELVLGQTCVRNNVVTLDNAREHQPKVNCNKFVEKWDVLLNSTGIGSLGRVGIIYFDNKNVCFDSHLTVVRTAEEIYRYYVGRNLLNRQKELENMAVGSTGQTELPKKDVLVMPILIPNSDVLPEFNEIIKNIGNTIYLLIEENRRLATLRDTLLPKLMSGQIKVGDVK